MYVKKKITNCSAVLAWKTAMLILHMFSQNAMYARPPHKQAMNHND